MNTSETLVSTLPLGLTAPITTNNTVADQLMEIMSRPLPLGLMALMDKNERYEEPPKEAMLLSEPALLLLRDFRSLVLHDKVRELTLETFIDGFLETYYGDEVVDDLDEMDIPIRRNLEDLIRSDSFQMVVKCLASISMSVPPEDYTVFTLSRD